MIKITGENLWDEYSKTYEGDSPHTDETRIHFIQVYGERIQLIKNSIKDKDVKAFRKQVSLSRGTYLGNLTRSLMKLLGIKNANNLDHLYVQVSKTIERD